MPRPDFSRVPSFYHNYLNQVKEDDLMTALKNNTASFLSFLKSIPPEKHDYRYDHGKWTVKEVVQHVIDSERVFSYRALCFARKDTSSLPGFDENIFAANSKAERRIWNDLTEEFAAVRKATEILFNSFDKEQLESEGISNKYSNYVMGWGFICAGHCNHHQQVMRERYL